MIRVRLRGSSVPISVAALLLLTLSGCATMPDNGAPSQSITSQSNATEDTQVQILAVPPAVDEQPDGLLGDFLTDQTSDESTFATARQYLMSSHVPWNPQERVTVLKNIDEHRVPTSNKTQYVIDVTGDVEATLDSEGAFTAGTGTSQSFSFTFEKNAKGQWRITDLKPGLILGEQDFKRLYESGDLYFPAKALDGSEGVPRLVADPIWVRSRIDPLTDAVRSLLTGPTGWVRPVVTSGVWPGLALDGPVTVEADGGTADVRFKSNGSGGLLDQSSCNELAAQLYGTLTSLAQNEIGAVPIMSVSLFRGGSQQDSCNQASGNQYMSQAPALAYYVGGSGSLTTLTVNTWASEKVPQALEPAGAGGIGAFAVEPVSSGDIAVVTPSGRDVYASAPVDSGVPVRLAFSSPDKGAFASPSWDSTGTLWVVDSAPGAPSQVMTTSATATAAATTAVPVTIRGLEPGQQVTGLKVAQDGARIALIVSEGTEQTVEVGLVERAGTVSAPQLTIDGLHSISSSPTATGDSSSSSLTGVSSLAWEDDDSLIVLGQTPTSSKDLSVWQIDGSSTLIPAAATLQSTDGMQTVAALDSAYAAPMLGDSDVAGEIYAWQAKTGTWKTEAKGATGTSPMPSYPG